MIARIWFPVDERLSYWPWEGSELPSRLILNSPALNHIYYPWGWLMQLHMNLTCHKTGVSSSMAFTHILKMKNHSWTGVILQQNFYDKVWAALPESLPVQSEDDSPIPIFEAMGRTILCIFHWASVSAVRILRELPGEMTELSSVPDKNFAWTFPNLK